uniref:PGG domain-containing protein n=3 Tax=Triticinae TaxID=1648030 RepID=A0A453J6G4_AEGTS
VDSCAWRSPEEEKRLKERRKFLLLLATFATPLTYGAGLAPPGGFWSETRPGHRAGAPLLHDGPYKIRYHAFFYANANSFVASLAIIMLLASSYALPVCVLVELLGLMAAYAAGSCRWITTTVYIIFLVGAVFLYILLQVVIAGHTKGMFTKCRRRICRILTCADLPPPDTYVNVIKLTPR